MSDLLDDTGSGRPIAGGWQLRRRSGPAAALHGLDLPDPATREVWILGPDRPALVLGSTQTDDLVARDALARRGVELVRRRSGGGAVLLDTATAIGATATLWIDVVVPRSDPLWLDDVGRSMDWLGEAWVRALAALGVAGAVHRGPLERTTGSALVCFAGVGPGEVVAGDRKVVGIAQRRTRAGARFQCSLHLAADGAHPSGPDPGGAVVPAGAEAIVELLAEPTSVAERAQLIARLRDRVGAVAAPAEAIADAFVTALPGDPDGGATVSPA